MAPWAALDSGQPHSRVRPALNSALFALALLQILFSALPASAEFLRTGSGVYQSMGRRAKIVVGTEAPGLFFYYGPAIDLQDFSANSFESADSASGAMHAFLRFDLQAGRYSSLVVGGQEFRVQGNFTLNIGPMRVTVDNSNQYCSIVVEEAGRAPEILGFFGTTAVINDEGVEAVSMLEGNQIQEYRNVFSPYEIRFDGLFVNQKPVTSGFVGLMVEPKNSCLRPGSAVISRASYNRLAANPDRQKSRRLLSELLKQRKKKDPLDGMLRLRTTAEVIIAMDPVKNDTFLVRKAPESSKDFRPPDVDRVCIIDPVKPEK